MAALEELLTDLFAGDQLRRAVLSKPRSTEVPAKTTIDPVELRGETAYRFTAHLPDRTTHENLAPDAARERLGALLERLRAGAAPGLGGRLAGAR